MAAKAAQMKSQVAMEYIILVGFVLVIIIPLIVLFYSQSSDITVQVKSQQVQSIGQNIVDNAESVYYLGEPSKVQIKIQLPENIKNTSINSKSIVFTLRTESGLTDVVVPSRVNISGSLPKSSGIHLVIIENKGNYVNITSN